MSPSAVPPPLTPEAAELNPRALPFDSPTGLAERVAVVFDPRGMPETTRRVLDAHPGLRLSPFIPPDARPGEFEPSEVVAEGERGLLEELATDHPPIALLVDAAQRLDEPPEAPLLMGVLNVTPDSFSDGGDYLEPAAAIDRGLEMAAAGAEIVDVGGESTRPGARTVELNEELERVMPVIEGLVAAGLRQLSIDTRKAPVARAALAAGATLVNDVSAGLADPELLGVVAESGAEVVLMHAQGDPEGMQVDPRYRDPVAEVARHLRLRAAAGLKAGVDPSRILIDPGIGFGKRLGHNLALIRRLGELRSLGHPLLVGVSRKSFIGHLSGAENQEDWRDPKRRDDPRDRLGGTAAAVTACVFGGARILRVHDVRVMAEALRVARALARPAGLPS